MSTLRDEAEALANGLEIGASDVSDVVAWSDARILGLDSVPHALCEVSLARDRYPHDVAGLLRQFPGTPDRSHAINLLLTLIDARLTGDATCVDQVASSLHRMAVADEIEDETLRQIGLWA